MSGHYSWGNIKTAIRNPKLVVRELHRLGSKPFHAVHNRRFASANGSGIDVMTEDWDTLVILDACRLDYFRSQHSFDGELRSVVSRGGNS